MGAFFLCRYDPSEFAKSIPMAREVPQSTCISVVATAKRTKKGPGHIPPMPHPNPKQKAPKSNCLSTMLF